jgi:uncharacterized protein (TIGR03067 family)
MNPIKGEINVRHFYLSMITTTFLVLMLGCSHKGLDKQTNKDKAALQGEWEIISAESNGEPPPAGLLDGAKLVFSADNLSLMGKDGTFELDARTSPRQINFIRGKVRQLGIYELDEDRLKLCVGPADDRPKEFKTKKFTDHSLFLLKRKQ